MGGWVNVVVLPKVIIVYESYMYVASYVFYTAMQKKLPKYFR